MSFTRFRDDDVRVEEQLHKSTYLGKYQLNKPGPGSDIPFMNDPQIRLEKFGANLRTNKINLESDLLGLTRKLNRDLTDENDYKKKEIPSNSVSFSRKDPFILESRASHPAWIYKDLEQSRWELPLINPQANIEQPFHFNVNSRILSKDNFDLKLPKNK
jgi:hypothetical protein